jgi:hypothetical protein
MAHRSTLALQNEASLLSKRALQTPTQIALLTAWFQHNSSSEVLINDLLADILARSGIRTGTTRPRPRTGPAAAGRARNARKRDAYGTALCAL